MGKLTKEQQLLNRYEFVVFLDFPAEYGDKRDNEAHDMLEEALRLRFPLDLRDPE